MDKYAFYTNIEILNIVVYIVTSCHYTVSSQSRLLLNPSKLTMVTERVYKKRLFNDMHSFFQYTIKLFV